MATIACNVKKETNFWWLLSPFFAIHRNFNLLPAKIKHRMPMLPDFFCNFINFIVLNSFCKLIYLTDIAMDQWLNIVLGVFKWLWFRWKPSLECTVCADERDMWSIAEVSFSAGGSTHPFVSEEQKSQHFWELYGNILNIRSYIYIKYTLNIVHIATYWNVMIGALNQTE